MQVTLSSQGFPHLLLANGRRSFPSSLRFSEVAPNTLADQYDGYAINPRCNEWFPGALSSFDPKYCTMSLREFQVSWVRTFQTNTQHPHCTSQNYQPFQIAAGQGNLCETGLQEVMENKGHGTMFVLVTHDIQPLARQPFAFAKGWLIHCFPPCPCAHRPRHCWGGPHDLAHSDRRRRHPIGIGRAASSSWDALHFEHPRFSCGQGGHGAWVAILLWRGALKVFETWNHEIVCQVVGTVSLTCHVMSRFCRWGVFPFSFRCESGPLQGPKSGMAMSLGQHSAPKRTRLMDSYTSPWGILESLRDDDLFLAWRHEIFFWRQSCMQCPCKTCMCICIIYL